MSKKPWNWTTSDIGIVGRGVAVQGTTHIYWQHADISWHGTTSNDGTVQFTLEGGQVPGVLAETDGDPVAGFAARDKFITDPSELGPLLDGEYYTYGPDFWGSSNAHGSVDSNPAQVAQYVDDLNFVLGANNSISLYVGG